MFTTLPCLNSILTPDCLAFWLEICTNLLLISRPVILYSPSFASSMARYQGPNATSKIASSPGRVFRRHPCPGHVILQMHGKSTVKARVTRCPSSWKMFKGGTLGGARYEEPCHRPKKGDMYDKSLSPVIGFRLAVLSNLDGLNDRIEDAITRVKDKDTLGHLENCKEDIKQILGKRNS